MSEMSIWRQVVKEITFKREPIELPYGDTQSAVVKFKLDPYFMNSTLFCVVDVGMVLQTIFFYMDEQSRLCFAKYLESRFKLHS